MASAQQASRDLHKRISVIPEANRGNGGLPHPPLRCDNGRGEYDNKLFRMLLAASGTSFEPCPPHAHHKNGVAERMIGVITEKARAMMIDSQAPLEFWGEAVGTAVYLHRLTLNEGLMKRDDRDGYKAAYDTPYEMLHAYGKPAVDPNGNKISYKAPPHHLRRFGCFVSRFPNRSAATNLVRGQSLAV